MRFSGRVLLSNVVRLSGRVRLNGGVRLSDKVRLSGGVRLLDVCCVLLEHLISFGNSG